MIWPFISMIIKLESNGPIFYSQIREGYKGKSFRLWKFRTMKVNAEEKGAIWAEKNDVRITRVGKFLRKTRLMSYLNFGMFNR